ncbi:hypothetical protein M011DRAFT_400847 [Sporormia fimetaria CBS 119925]|uniref:DUF3176 domain-containing protein n=1 Tax=Sporormia fimetaria CBS 119925 TaxID=1340428 RepID=A0A6A6VCC4_9PLEO|nr:hypothetical protein M011DRAFT_400847 [Sporormia fimetaria CBS 119925]
MPPPVVPPKDEEQPNFAQRLEEKIWNYNTSGGFVKRWLLEIISWTLSALCMGAIVTMLLYFKDKPLPKWPLGLTLNAYIAVLAKVASIALVLPTTEAIGQLKWSWFTGDPKEMWDFEIFDDASRGPWGAFMLLMLLFRSKGRSFAALGAIIVIFSQALDPFFQQVVSFPERLVRDARNSTLTNVVEYTPIKEILFQNGVRMVMEDPETDNVMDRFFFDNGTQPIPFGNGMRPEIPLSCPTSKCTWPKYDTLAVCSSCTDLDASEFLAFDCQTVELDWLFHRNPSPVDPPLPKANGTVCGYFLNSTSDDPTLMTGYLIDVVDSSANFSARGWGPNATLISRTLPLVTIPRRRLLFGGSINYKHVYHRIADVIIVSAPDAASVHQNSTPVIQECMLAWCIKTMQSSYDRANYTEEELSRTYANAANLPFPLTAEVVSDGTDSGTAVVPNYNVNVTIHSPETGKAYGVTNDTALASIQSFDLIFPSMTVARNSSDDDADLFFDLSFVSPPRRKLDFNPWVARENYTIGGHMERLATALTDAMRSSRSKNYVNGTAFDVEIYVSVQFYWLILPLGLLALSLIFLLSTMIRSSHERDRVGIWKNSAIAALIYGLPDEMQRKITSSVAKGTPRARAKGLRVRMLSKRWRVSGNLFSPMPPKPKRNRTPPGWI